MKIQTKIKAKCPNTFEITSRAFNLRISKTVIYVRSTISSTLQETHLTNSVNSVNPLVSMSASKLSVNIESAAQGFRVSLVDLRYLPPLDLKILWPHAALAFKA